jgi:hypothetical protein
MPTSEGVYLYQVRYANEDGRVSPLSNVLTIDKPAFVASPQPVSSAAVPKTTNASLAQSQAKVNHTK